MPCPYGYRAPIASLLRLELHILHAAGERAQFRAIGGVCALCKNKPFNPHAVGSTTSRRDPGSLPATQLIIRIC